MLIDCTHTVTDVYKLASTKGAQLQYLHLRTKQKEWFNKLWLESTAPAENEFKLDAFVLKLLCTNARIVKESAVGGEK